MAYLTGTGDDGKALRIDLPESGEAILGRSLERATVLVSAGSVSGCHCSLTQSDGVWTVKDLGSTNGTRVNGQTVTEEQVYRGDTLSLGDLPFELQGDDVAVRDGGGSKSSGGPAEPAPAPDPMESPAMKIEPLSPKSPTVRVLPAQFKKRSAHTGRWVAVIAVFALLALVLAFLFFRNLF